MGVGKADQIALPDFNAGAMENWGLVTYREQSLLYDMNRDRFDRKFYVANVVSHEMAHMWFGDFVTCQFWDELWLNEAFATFISYVGLEENRDLETGRAFIANRYPAALQHDQTTSSNPIVNIENNNGKVDGHPKAGSSNIIYSKGGIILKNIRCFLGDEVFFGGLQNYLEEFKYSNPTTYDLTAAWENMRNEVGVLLKGKTVGDHWDPWLRQMGYPFLTVKYTDENTKGINIAQKRFLN
ncbi:unnamed protein product [Oikopleura dioica]|nr:unnamed protein product [Oikopleura dioica]